jgi:tight adherence protein B
MLGLGLLLIWRSGPRAPIRRSSLGIGWHRRRTDLLRQAGVDGVGSTQLLGAQVVCAALVGLVVLLLTGALAVAVCFAGFAFVAPITVLRGTRRRRMAALRELWPEAIDHLASAVRAGMSLPEGG